MTRSLFPAINRSMIGFEDLIREFERINQSKNTNYPPYNIIQHGDNSYEIVMAVAGFSKNDVEVTLGEQSLTVSGRAVESDLPEGSEVLHRGMALRDFSRSFPLGKDVVVRSAEMTDGVLHVKLEREVKEDSVKKIDII